MLNAKFIPLSINADDEPKTLKPSEMLNIENLRVGVSEDGKNFQIVNIPSSEIIYSVTTPYVNVANGTAKDFSRQRLLWFAKNDYSFDTIYAYDISLNVTYIVLLSSQVSGGLNFSNTKRIDKNARIIGDLLFWTNDLNEPKCINIERGIKLNQPSYIANVAPYVTPIPQTSITIIVRPPIYRLQVQKITDAGFLNNFISTNAYQFYYRYWYKDYQYSVLSVFSQLIPYNGAEETFNAITVKMPFTEDIPDEVQQVDLCIRYGNIGKSFIVKSYNKDNYYDLLAIRSHNANTVQLGFTFYDNIAGIAIDDLTASTPFDNVALLAKTLDAARNREFLANVLKGYNTPSTTSLSLSLGTYDTGGGGSYAADWKYFRLTYTNGTFTSTQTFYYAYVASLSESSYYYSAFQSAFAPPSVNGEDADTSWATQDQLAAWVQRNISPPSGYHWVNGPYVFFSTGDTTTLIFTVDLNGLQFFKSSSVVQVTTTFFDQYRRKCGVVRNAIQISIPDRTATQTAFATTINWMLSNDDALNEIPGWAYYYMIEVTKNQTTRFFEQMYINATAYVIKNQDGTYDYSGTSFSLNSTYAIGLDITALTSKGLGYVFAEGDFVRIYFNDGTNVLLPVIGQDGNFVLAKPEDIGALGSSTGIFIELFTPYRPSVDEPFFETGDMLPILNPTTNIRTYSQTSGSINGDCYAIERDRGSSSFYFTEAMSPNDKIWQIWQTDRGWVNLIDTIGQQRKETNIDWSDTYINGTKTNGLNKFQPLNTKDVGNSSGSIQKLQLTNKQTEDGTVLLVITETDHLSAYLQEVQLVAASKNNSIVQTDDVIGTINALRNGHGTINPESVEEYNGVVWGLSAINGVAWQYANDGVTDISDNKMWSFFDRYFKRYLAQGFNSETQPIHSVYDVSTDEVLFMLPAVEDYSFIKLLPSYLIGSGIWKYMRLYYTTDDITQIPLNLYYILLDDTSAYYPEIFQTEATLPFFVNFSDITAVGFPEVALAEYILEHFPPPAGSWVDPQTPTYFIVADNTVDLFDAPGGTTSIENRFMFYDGQAKTVVYKANQNKWVGAYQWMPDCMASFGSKLFAFNAASLYLFNENFNSFNTIFGVQYPQRICMPINIGDPSAVKDILNMALECNGKIPNFTVLYSEYPYVQITDLSATDTNADGSLKWENKEGVLYVSFFKDRLSPNIAGSVVDKMLEGDLINSQSPMLMLEWSSYNEQLILNFINIGFQLSRGQSALLTKTNG